MGEPTDIFNRKVRHWKTTIAGISLLGLGIASIVWPEHAAKLAQISALLNGGAFLFAADAQKPTPVK